MNKINFKDMSPEAFLAIGLHLKNEINDYKCNEHKYNFIKKLIKKHEFHQNMKLYNNWKIYRNSPTVIDPRNEILATYFKNKK